MGNVRWLMQSKHSGLQFSNYRHCFCFDFVSCLGEVTVYIRNQHCASLFVSHQMMLHLLIHGLFILVFTRQQNDGCLIILQMSLPTNCMADVIYSENNCQKTKAVHLTYQNILGCVTFHRQPLHNATTGFALG